MERKPEKILNFTANTPPPKNDRIPTKPCEKPHTNGSKPIELIRTQENQKKHIKRDGKR